jgi:hypothetical protein
MHRTRRQLVAAVTGLNYHGPARRDAPTDADPAQGGAGAGDTTDPATDPAKKPEIKGDLDPDRAARAIQAARDAEKAAKERAQTAEQKHKDALDAIAVALGLKPDPKTDTAAMAAQTAKERDDANAVARAKTVELEVFRRAGKAGGDPDSLLDSRTFLARLAVLDPAASDFAEKVEAAIKDAIKENPKLAATAAQGGQGPARQGTDVTGSSGGGKQRTQGLGASVAAALNPKQ